jgi:sensor histidine kinase YesM
MRKIDKPGAVRRLIRRLVPAGLKYRLFLAFILLVLIPLAVSQYYQFKKIEGLIERRISQLNDNQLEHMGMTLEEIKSKVVMSMLVLENDPRIVAYLRHPFDTDPFRRVSEIDAAFKRLQEYVSSPYVEFTLADLHGNRYYSYQPADGKDDPVIPPRGYEALLARSDAYYLLLDEEESAAVWDNAPLFTLFSVIHGPERRPIGMLRIRVDYEDWFRDAAKELSYGQGFLIVNGDGRIIAQTKTGAPLDADRIRRLIGNLAEKGISYSLNEQTDALTNIRYLPSLDWYVINEFPLDLFLGDLNALQRQVLATLFAVIAVFSAVTFLISDSVTRPLRRLQQKMKVMAKHNLNIRVPDQGGHSEIQALNQSFNRMVEDLNELVAQLKQEERRKEAIYSRMLLLQINPHFLLNTLNSIKWIAMEQRNREIADICVSLGKLLETSLNSAIELIPLREELKLVRAYLHIQQFRYGPLFEVEYETAQAPELALVPKLSLQPLVENAIHHGLSHMESGGRIRIRAYADGRRMTIEVDDNGAGPYRSPAPVAQRRKGGGIGLSNLRERYRLLFKEEAQVRLLALSPGTRAQLVFPLLTSAPYNSAPSDRMLFQDVPCKIAPSEVKGEMRDVETVDRGR